MHIWECVSLKREYSTLDLVILDVNSMRAFLQVMICLIYKLQEDEQGDEIDEKEVKPNSIMVKKEYKGAREMYRLMRKMQMKFKVLNICQKKQTSPRELFMDAITKTID